MSNVIEIHTEGKDQEPRSALDELCLAGAQQMLHRALELEVEGYLERSRRRPVAVETASVAGWALVRGLADLLIDDQVQLSGGRARDAGFREEIANLFLDALIPEEALPREGVPD